MGILRATTNLDQSGLLRRTGSRRTFEESLSRIVINSNCHLQSVHWVQAQHTLHSLAPLITPQHRDWDNHCAHFQMRIPRFRDISCLLRGTWLVGGRSRCSGKLGPSILPGEEASLPVTWAFIVSGDQAISFDLGLLRASQVRTSALLITHPPDKSHRN